MAEYIWTADKGRTNESELPHKITEKIQSGSWIAFYSNKKYIKGNLSNSGFTPVPDDFPHLLEIRVFNGQGEFKAIRPQIGGDFVWRITNDECIPDENKFDETHFLTEPDGDGNKKVKIRNYIIYDDDSGSLRIADNRILEFSKGGEVNA